MDKAGLIEYLINMRRLKSGNVIRAFKEIDRADFVPSELEDDAYLDYPLKIGFGQTISQPSTLAFMLELLELYAGQNVMDVGSGSGYSTALISKIVGNTGKVTGVEIVSELVKFGQDNLMKYYLPNASINQAMSTLGSRKLSPFDRILVSASAETLPTELVDQLAPRGVMVIPIGNSIFKMVKDSQGKITSNEYAGFVFVPLIE